MKRSENAVPLTTSIFRASERQRVDDITVTQLEDSPELLVELWLGDKVVHQFLTRGPLKRVFTRTLPPSGTVRKSILR